MDCIFVDNLYYNHYKKYIYIEDNTLYLIKPNWFDEVLFFIKWGFLCFSKKEKQFKIKIFNSCNPSIKVLDWNKKLIDYSISFADIHYFNSDVVLENCVISRRPYPYFVDQMYFFNNIERINCVFIEE